MKRQSDNSNAVWEYIKVEDDGTMADSGQFIGQVPTHTKSLLQLIHHPVLLEKLNNEIVGYNPAFGTFFNLSKKSIVGQKTSDFIPDYFQVIQKSDQKLLKNPEKSFAVNIEIKGHFEQVHRIQLRRCLLFQTDGSIGGFINVLIDPTRTKQLESNFKKGIQIAKTLSQFSSRLLDIRENEIEKLIRGFLQSIGELNSVDGVALFQFSDDLKSCKMSSNWSREGLVPETLKTGDFPTAPYRWWLENLHQTKSIRINQVSDLPAEAEPERQMLTKCRVKSILSISMKSQGKLTGFAAFVSTEQEKFWEDEDINILVTIANMISNAAQRIHMEQEKSVIQSQLIHSQRIEDIGNLAGGIAHDFNNILTVIQGRIQLLMMHTEKDDLRLKDLQHIMDTTTRAASLTRQLLIFSRKHEVDLKIINLNMVIQNVYQMLKHLIRENISFETHLAADLWKVSADESNIEQIILNLVINARDAISDSGRIIIKTENITLQPKDIKVIPESRSGNFIRLSVEDNGCGIPVDIIKNIFDPFFSTKDKEQGTGLGLSVVYGIVKKHNGWINLYSELNQGTIFKIYLPVSEVKKNATQKDESALLKDYRGNRESILIVEDNLDVLQTLDELLTMSNYKVLKAANAESAMDQFSDHGDEIILVITDIILPGMSGRQLVNQLQSRKPDLKVILTSGYSPEKLNFPTAEMNQSIFMQKPIQSRELLVNLKKLLKK